jgi:hypothetical protein
VNVADHLFLHFFDTSSFSSLFNPVGTGIRYMSLVVVIAQQQKHCSR